MILSSGLQLPVALAVTFTDASKNVRLDGIVITGRQETVRFERGDDMNLISNMLSIFSVVSSTTAGFPSHSTPASLVGTVGFQGD